MADDELGAESRPPWWRPWAIAAVSAASVTMAVGLLLGVAAAILGADVQWGTVVAVSALVVAFELPFMAALALLGRMALAQLKHSAEQNELLVERRRSRRESRGDS